jgi:hypothetical protein
VNSIGHPNLFFAAAAAKLFTVGYGKDSLR